MTGQEDCDTLLAVSYYHTETFVDDPAYIYHKHSRQTTQNGWFDAENLSHRKQMHEHNVARRKLHGDSFEELELTIPTAADKEQSASKRLN